MTPRTFLVLVWAAARSLRYLLGNDVAFPRRHLGDVLEMPDGDAFVVYRETVLRPPRAAAAGDPCVLVFRMQVDEPAVGATVRRTLFDPLANVATPFFAGLPGFREKLWLAGERPGEFLELYEWASREDADRFVDLLESLLDPFDFAGEASFEVVGDDTMEAYVAGRAIEWRGAAADDERRRAGSSEASGRRAAPEGGRDGVLKPAVLALVALLVGFLLGRGRRS